MSGKTYSGTYANGILLTNFASNNLVLEVLGTSENASVNSWFGANASAQLSEIVANRLKFDSGVNQLVTAMATYSAAHPGFNPTAPGTVMPSNAALQTAIVAAWHT